jgi:hypothetical protein
MTAKRLFTWTLFFVLFVVRVALFWRQRFDRTPPSLRGPGGAIEGGDADIYGESPRQDGMAGPAMLAVAQGYERAAQRLEQLRQAPLAAR